VPSFALRNPFTVIVGALIVTILGVTAYTRMPVDVFPNLKIPAVVIATFYPGMPPLDMERDITTRYERFFTLGSGIEHIESRSLPGVSMITVYLHGGVDVDAAAAQFATLAMADLGVLPPGTLPPLVLKFDASSLPVTLVTVEGKGFSQADIEDQARYNIRNQLATVSGASVPMPFGGKIRQIMAYLDRQFAAGARPLAQLGSRRDQQHQPDPSGRGRENRQHRLLHLFQCADRTPREPE
jgi:multidrug efflux pump subunit AcrB